MLKTTALFTPNGPGNTTPVNIPVCFIEAGFGPEKLIIQSSVARSWSRVSMVTFTDWGQCPTSGTAQHIRISINPSAGIDQTFGFGQAALRTPGGTSMGLGGSGWSNRDRLRYLAIHEFGHVLGFPHEDDRPDRPAHCSNAEIWGGLKFFGPFDANSVMNSSGLPGCPNVYGNSHGYLSDIDIETVRNMYGTRTPRVSGDFDGDGQAEIGIWRPGTGQWFIPGTALAKFGVAGDVPVPGDYNGDGVTDRAVYNRPGCTVAGCWWRVDLGTTAYDLLWGVAGDVPVPGDYNGDGRVAPAVWRPSTRTWYTSDCGGCSRVWGNTGDIPVPGDYDGDGTTDIAVWRPSTGEWIISRDNGAYNHTLGLPTDIPVPGDYASQGRVQPAVYRPSTGEWLFRLRPANLPSPFFLGGMTNDVPVPGSFSGTGATIPRIWRPGATSKFIMPGGFTIWGNCTTPNSSSCDVPLPRGIN